MMRFMSFIYNRRIAAAMSAALISLLPSALCAAALPSDDGAAMISELAAQHSPLIKAAAERARAADAEAETAASARRPNLVFAAGGIWSKDDIVSAAFDPASGRPIAAVPLAGRDLYYASLAVVHALSTGGSAEARQRAAELHAKAERARAVRVYQSVLSAARSAWYMCGRARAHLEVASEAASLSLEHLKRAEALCDAGVVPIGDVLRVKVAVSQADLDVIRAESALVDAWAALESAVGTSVPREALDRSALPEPGYTPQEDALERALASRPELAIFDLEAESARKMMKAARGARRPSLYAAGGLAAIGDDFPPRGSHDWAVGLSLIWTVYDGGELKSRERAAAAAARELEHLLDDMSASVRREVLQAENALRSAAKRYAAAMDQVATAEEDHRIAMRRYDSQVGTNIDVLDARVALTASRTARVDALYDMAAARSDLAAATASDQPPEGLFDR